jgi:Domain of unknown function (DUF3459)
LHKELIAPRRSDPVINGKERHSLDGAVYGQHAFVLRYFGHQDANDRLLTINFDRDLVVSPAAAVKKKAASAQTAASNDPDPPQPTKGFAEFYL